MLCVSEYLPNGDLEEYIRTDTCRQDGKPRDLSWAMQGRDIALDVARGMALIHANEVCWWHHTLFRSCVLAPRS